MDPNQNQPQPLQPVQPVQQPMAPVQDVQPVLQQSASPFATQPQAVAQNAPMQPAVEPVLVPTQSITQTPSVVSLEPAAPTLSSPITAQPAAQQPLAPQPQMMNQPMQVTSQTPKKSKKRLIIVLAAVGLAIAAIAASLLLFVFNQSAEEKAFRSFISAYNDKNCSMAVSYMAPSVYEGQTKDEFVKECEDNKDIVFDVTGIEVVSVKKISGDDKKATLEAVERKDSEEKTATVSLVKVDGDWLVEDIETN